MTIAGHTFNANGFCSCGRTWRNLVDRRLEWTPGATDLAHVGVLNAAEVNELHRAWAIEQERVWAATFPRPAAQETEEPAQQEWVEF